MYFLWKHLLADGQTLNLEDIKAIGISWWKSGWWQESIVLCCLHDFLVFAAKFWVQILWDKTSFNSSRHWWINFIRHPCITGRTGAWSFPIRGSPTERWVVIAVTGCCSELSGVIAQFWFPLFWDPIAVRVGISNLNTLVTASRNGINTCQD